MFDKEHEIPVNINIFEESERYNKFIEKHGMGNSYGNRAKATIGTNGEIIIAIDRPYYLSGGIKPEEIEAIIVHEKTEILDCSDNPHENATLAEYRYILEKFGGERLKSYHVNLCNLMGGDNSVREKVLNSLRNEWTKTFCS